MVRSPHFFGAVLEHRFVQENLDQEALAAVNFNLERATWAIGVDRGVVMSFSTAIIGAHGDAVLAANIGDCESFGLISVNVFPQASHFIGGPPLTQWDFPR